MNTLQLLSVFEAQAEMPNFEKKKVKVESLGKQSVKIIHPCGCYAVQHLLCNVRGCSNIARVDRQFYVKLWEELHETIHNATQ